MKSTVEEHGISSRTKVFRGLEKIGEVLDSMHSGKLESETIIVVD